MGQLRVVSGQLGAIERILPHSDMNVRGSIVKSPRRTRKVGFLAVKVARGTRQVCRGVSQIAGVPVEIETGCGKVASPSMYVARERLYIRVD